MLNSQQKEMLDDLWIDALLTEVYTQAPETEQPRIDRLMSQLDSSISESTRTVVTDPNPERVSRRRVWMSWTVVLAACIAFLSFFLAPIDSTNAEAIAIVQRGMQRTTGIRRYAIEMTGRSNAPKTRWSAQLYIDPSDRFVLERPALFGPGQAILGGSGIERWIVPPRGPALIGRNELIANWLMQKDSDSPYLHLDTALQRLARDYALELLPDESLTNEESPNEKIDCRHLQGTRNVTNPRMPSRIELWTDRESGIVQQLILHWSPSANSSEPRQWKLRLTGHPEIEPSWFQIESHLRKNQRLIRFDAKATVESIEKVATDTMSTTGE